jgi:hypothetical protein
MHHLAWQAERARAAHPGVVGEAGGDVRTAHGK